MVIDLSVIRSVPQLHTVLQEQLNFPSFYGRNWEALRENLAEMSGMPSRLTLTGYPHFATMFPEEHRILLRIVDDYNTRFSPGNKIELS